MIYIYSYISEMIRKYFPIFPEVQRGPQVHSQWTWESLALCKQFWSYQTSQNFLSNPARCMNCSEILGYFDPIAHGNCLFVWHQLTLCKLIKYLNSDWFCSVFSLIYICLFFANRPIHKMSTVWNGIQKIRHYLHHVRTIISLNCGE